SPAPRTWSPPRSRPSASRAGTGSCWRWSCEVEPPVVAAQHVARRVLELERAVQREPQLAADGVRRRVVHVRERAEEAAVGGDEREQPAHGRGGDAAALEGRQHGPAGLVDRLVAPLALPVADPAG